ncbi:penicillin-binding protein 2 [Cryobacterium sp. BB736]|uniref:peptidoglycan D,D-transpeptidase FtsI family protein n=1 Tax=Cryobacterium sp. BB736 TaxID=2746963 RepID=UPI001876FFBD|nr:penicillin-binding protein 2 [Cryobacterium sp. BB736]
MVELRRTRRRLSIAVLLTFAIVALFVVRLVDFQVVRAAELNEASHGKRAVSQTIYAPRGDIVDTNGVVLADSVTRYDITASPRHANAFNRRADVGTTQKVSVFDALTEISEISGADINKLMTAISSDPESNFTYLVKGVDTAKYRAIRDLGIPWVYVETVPKRTYPNGSVAGNIVGFVGTDGPQNGIEVTENDCLEPTKGVSTYEQGADGVRLPGSTVVSTEAVPGGTITLTIDSDLQWSVQQTIAEQAIAIGAESAMAVVVRVSDGHLMAAADWPSVDPNDRDGLDPAFLGARMFTYNFEPGSILKAMTAAMAVDQGTASANTKVTVPSRWETPEGSVIRDATNHGEYRLTLPGVLAESSNVGISKVASELANAVRYDYLRKFGFGEETAVGFQGEEKGLLASSWDSQQKYDIAYGQGVSVTLAQMASAYQALANGGVRMPLTVVESCTLPDGTVLRPEASQGVRVVSESAAQQTVDMLQSVVTNGQLSSVLSIPGYNVAAKTGTGEVAEGGVYTNERIVSVAGIAPADNPEYVVIVTIVKPDIMKTSYAAAPVFQEIMARVLKTYRVPLSIKPAPNLPTTW